MALGAVWRLIGRGRLHFPMAPRQLHGLDKSLHARRVMITCDRGGRRLALASYKYGSARALPVHPPCSSFFFMAPSRRFLAAEKGKARQVEPASPPPKRGRGRPRKHPVASTAAPRGRGDDFQHGDGRTAAVGGRALVARSTRPRFRAAEVLPEFVVWSAEPTSTHLPLPRFLLDEPPAGAQGGL